MTTPVLVLKHHEGIEGELDQRMDSEYVAVFAPELVLYNRRYRLNNAYIIPVERLLPDQIALLRSRGAFQTQAETVTGEYDASTNITASLQHPIRKAQLFDFVCVFNRYVIGRHVWLEAYTVPQSPFLRNNFHMFQRFGAGGWTSTFTPWPPSS